MTNYDNGTLKLELPDRWQVFGSTDVEGKENPERIYVYKDVDAPFEIFSRAGITVSYYGDEDYYLPTRGFYDNVRDIEPIELGGRVWQGYTCLSLGYPYVMLEHFWGERVLFLMVLLKNGEYEISMDDDDVRSIIGSISIIEKTEE